MPSLRVTVRGEVSDRRELMNAVEKALGNKFSFNKTGGCTRTTEDNYLVEAIVKPKKS